MGQAVFIGARPWRAADWPRHAAASLLGRLLAERERWGLWLPVGFAAGIGLYFALPSEPWPWIGAAGASLAATVAWLARRSSHAAAPAVLAYAVSRTIIAAGFAVAQFQSWRLATPMLDHSLGAVVLTGTVVDLSLIHI